MTLTRRQFLGALAGVGAAGASARLLAAEPIRSETSRLPVVDFHVHLFGSGDGGTGCWLSEKQKHHVNYRYFLKLLRLEENGRLDQDYLERLVGQLRASSVRKAVVQAWDGRYDERGRFDRERTTSVYVPNDYLFKVVRRHPDLLIPCASINPKRRDALDELERCAALGARVLKVHPPTMDVDPADQRFRPFWRRCAERRYIVIVHTGAEHAADIASIEFCNPDRLANVLEAGCTVIAAHAGTTAFFDKVDFFPNMLAMTRRFPNLYCDTSIMGAMVRWRSLPRLLEQPDVLARAVHGSDFPFPANALAFWNRLPMRTLFRLLGEHNLFERDLRLKQAIGLPDDVFRRGARLLGLSSA